MGAGLGVDRARDEGPADERVHRLRRVEHGDRRRDGRDSHRPRRRDVRGRHRGADHRRSASPASMRCARCRAATTIPSRRHGRSTRSATGSSWARRQRCWCWRSSSTRGRAARSIYAELVGYGISSDASHMTEPDPTGESPARAMTMALDDAGVEPDRGRLCQCACDFDTARRRCRDEGDQDRIR